jgi:5'-nucleotidase
LRKWGVYVDEAYFLGGLRKDELLKAFGAHIFFDDQDTHLSSSSKYVPAGKVPYYSGSQINDVIAAREAAKKANDNEE